LADWGKPKSSKNPFERGGFFCQECQKISLTGPTIFEKMPNLFSESGGGGDENHSVLIY
jgi:hypothetical protein